MEKNGQAQIAIKISPTGFITVPPIASFAYNE
jgi:hypothetical protein